MPGPLWHLICTKFQLFVIWDKLALYLVQIDAQTAPSKGAIWDDYLSNISITA